MTAPGFLGPPWDARRSGDAAARPGDWRAFHDRDRARIIHSAAFRRLQAKTQVLGVGEDDFTRTRLTHSMETAQIAQGIRGALAHAASTPEAARAALPPASLIEAIALAHDLGHPPFGHGGEAALDECMADHGGFEGNAQTLRLLSTLEGGAHGLDLARRTLLGVLKYPRPLAGGGAGTKGYYETEAALVEWIVEPFDAADRAAFAAAGAAHKALDTTIMDLADDIAYGVHDLEDALALRLIEPDALVASIRPALAASRGMLAAPGDALLADLLSAEGATRKRGIGGLVHFLVVQARAAPRGRFRHPLLDFAADLPAPARGLLDALKDLVRREVILRPAVQLIEQYGQEMLRRIFVAYTDRPARFLSGRDGTPPIARDVCDAIACMSDDEATRVHDRLFVPRARAAAGRP